MKRLIPLLPLLLNACAPAHPDERQLTIYNLFGRDLSVEVVQYPLSNTEGYLCDESSTDQISLLITDVPDSDGAEVIEWKVLQEDATERLCLEKDEDGFCIDSEVCIQLWYGGDKSRENHTDVTLWGEGLQCALGLSDGDGADRESAICGY